MKLKQIATINSGHPFRGKIPECIDAPDIAVQMKDVSLSEGICWSTCVATELAGKSKPDCLAPGDILLAARGNHNYAVHVDQTLSSLGKRAVAAPHFFVVTVRQKDVLPEFLAWLLNQSSIQRYFEQNAEGTLTKSIRRSVLEDTPVVVPPLAKQQVIIAMAEVLRQEQRLIKQLVDNGERMMSAIATEILSL